MKIRCGAKLRHSSTASSPLAADLHVWIWAENPAGLFTQFNPQLQCS